MEILALILIIYGFKKAVEASKKGWRASKSAYMKSADARFPGAPKAKRAMWALRHDAGYLAAQVAHGFPMARHGFAYGWHEGRKEHAERRAAREKVKAERLEAQATLAPHVAGYRQRQQAAAESIRATERATRQDAEAGSAGSGEGTPPPAGDGRTYSWGPAASPYQWPASGPEDAHLSARQASTGGSPYTVTEYGPGAGPGTMAGAYLSGQEFHPTDIQRAVWDARADTQRQDDIRQGRVKYPPADNDTGDTPRQYVTGTVVPEEEEECYLCGLSLAGDDDGTGAHPRCGQVYERDSARHEVRDNRDPDLVERSLRDEGRCPWQVTPGGHEGDAAYCGQAITGTGGDTPDLYCLTHQADADGDYEGAAQELNEHVRGLLEQDTRQAPQLEITQGGTPMSDVNYDSVLRSMSDATAQAEITSAEANTAARDAEQRAAEAANASKTAAGLADSMQALRVDPGTLSAMAEHLEAHDAAAAAELAVQEAVTAAQKAHQRVLETAQAVDQTLTRGHAGLNEAHQNAPVEAADREFYQG